jgi:hypothetical protein
VRDGIAAAATDTDDLDLGALVKGFFIDKFNGHVALLMFHGLGQWEKLKKKTEK